MKRQGKHSLNVLYLLLQIVQKMMFDPLLSWFVIIEVGKYSYEEFKAMVMRILIEREHLEDENLAAAIVINRTILA